MRDERELIRRAGQGDQEAFRQLVETYQAPAYRLALRMCGGDAALAEDAAQEAFLAAWRGLPRFRGDSRFSTWLYRLTTNAAIDCLRREKRHRDADDLDGVELPDGGDTPQEAAERTETQTMASALGALLLLLLALFAAAAFGVRRMQGLLRELAGVYIPGVSALALAGAMLLLASGMDRSRSSQKAKPVFSMCAQL